MRGGGRTRFAQFGAVEASCSRFDPQSELRALTARVGERVPVSPLLFEATRFARAVAAASGGAFDPTVGYALERRGFNRNYRTGVALTATLPTESTRASYRDIRLDPTARTITLARPLVLDLGAVAKGLAMDLAARELDAFPDYQIEAGGDVRVRGHNADGQPVADRHPPPPAGRRGVHRAFRLGRARFARRATTSGAPLPMKATRAARAAGITSLIRARTTPHGWRSASRRLHQRRWRQTPFPRRHSCSAPTRAFAFSNGRASRA